MPSKKTKKSSVPRPKRSSKSEVGPPRRSRTAGPTRSFLLKYGLPTAVIPGIILATVFGFNYEKLIAKDPRTNHQIYATHQQVTEITDGDTIQLETGLPIRLIGLNAPDKGEPYFNEARTFLVESIGKKLVDIEYDRVQNDNYGRLRGYAFISCKSDQDGCQKGLLNLNIALVKNGLAKTQFNKLWSKPKYKDELLEAEKYAKQHKLNLWAD